MVSNLVVEIAIYNFHLFHSALENKRVNLSLGGTKTHPSESVVLTIKITICGRNWPFPAVKGPFDTLSVKKNRQKNGALVGSHNGSCFNLP